jgi:hypothetical protein
MASGSFNINTFSYRHQLPLSNEYTAFSTGTMFAVGFSSFTEGYSFYDYSYGLCGFPDTSTMSVSMTRLMSTAFSTTMNNFSNIVNYLSTDAMYNRTFQYTFNTVSTLLSTAATSTGNYPLEFVGPTLNLRDGIIDSNGPISVFDVVRARTHSIQIDFDYNLVLSKAGEDFNWVSTIGYFGDFTSNIPVRNRVYMTRVGVNSNYTSLSPRMTFDISENDCIPTGASTFTFRLNIQSNAGISTASPAFSIYVPGNTNYTFTFFPLKSNIFDLPQPVAPLQSIV